MPIFLEKNMPSSVAQGKANLVQLAQNGQKFEVERSNGSILIVTN